MSKLRNAFVLALLPSSFILYYLYWYTDRTPGPRPLATSPTVILEKPLHHGGIATSCFGPRGTLLSDSADDQLIPVELDIPYPKAPFGSFDELGLSKTWMTAAIRYGPYGYENNKNNRSSVQWDEVDWAMLQDDCVARNQYRFGTAVKMLEPSRLVTRWTWDRFFESPPPLDPHNLTKSTGRTAIVLRSYDTYHYTLEDMLNIRSLIVEASLNSGGEYAVHLLVHIRNKRLKIFKSEENYYSAMEKFVPRELQSIAILFDDNMLESWYPKAETHRPVFQIYQALQIFAHFYPEYDHFWELETDVRFTGDSLAWLSAMSSFARKEPRKQALERYSYFYMPSAHGSYADLTAKINTTLKGGGVWGAMTIPDVAPLGPIPPVATPEEDDFSWGVGEDADLIVTDPCANVTLAKDWVFREWIHHFKRGYNTPRIYCPPAVARASRMLLAAVHDAQLHKGLSLPSEATLSSFALFHGLKFVYPPQPWFQNPARDDAAMDEFFNGGAPGVRNGGMAMGDAMYHAAPYSAITSQGTWWWSSPFPGYIMHNWLAKKGERDAELPYVLHQDENGDVWAPNLAMHPVKTNKNPP